MNGRSNMTRWKNALTISDTTDDSFELFCSSSTELSHFQKLFRVKKYYKYFLNNFNLGRQRDIRQGSVV